MPVASICGSDVLAETESLTRNGHGTCVGKRFSGIEWSVIRITDEPIASICNAEELATGEIGELIVKGAVVTSEYVTRTDCNPLAKIIDGNAFWHRMGDVGYLDEEDRFWFCGRMSHRIVTPNETMFTIPLRSDLQQPC